MARPIYRDATYMITRRTTQRKLFLKPSEAVNQILLYSVAVAAQKYGIRIHAITVMTNHYHIVLTDPRGRLPDFERWMNSIAARALNAHYGRWENLWSTAQPSHVELLGPDEVLEKMVYTITNPVKDGLVRSGEEWPGIRLFTPGKRRIERPKTFFDDCGDLPAVVELEIVIAPLGVPEHQALRMIREAVAAQEAKIRSEFRGQGRSFAGPQKVRALPVESSPASHAPRRQLSPRLATKKTEKMHAAIERWRRFVADYRQALAAWKKRIKGTVFPYGTFLLAQRFGVTVAAPS